jgi:hypothetical protein
MTLDDPDPVIARDVEPLEEPLYPLVGAEAVPRTT